MNRTIPRLGSDASRSEDPSSLSALHGRKRSPPGYKDVCVELVRLESRISESRTFMAARPPADYVVHLASLTRWCPQCARTLARETRAACGRRIRAARLGDVRCASAEHEVSTAVLALVHQRNIRVGNRVRLATHILSPPLAECSASDRDRGYISYPYLRYRFTLSCTRWLSRVQLCVMCIYPSMHFVHVIVRCVV